MIAVVSYGMVRIVVNQCDCSHEEMSACCDSSSLDNYDDSDDEVNGRYRCATNTGSTEIGLDVQ